MRTSNTCVCIFVFYNTIIASRASCNQWKSGAVRKYRNPWPAAIMWIITVCIVVPQSLTLSTEICICENVPSGQVCNGPRTWILLLQPCFSDSAQWDHRHLRYYVTCPLGVHNLFMKPGHGCPLKVYSLLYLAYKSLMCAIGEIHYETLSWP